MEIGIALFLGAWLSASGIIAYIQVKKDFKDAVEEKQ